MVRIKNTTPSAASARIPLRVLHFILHFLAGQRAVTVMPLPPGKSGPRKRHQEPKNQPTPLNIQGIALCLLKTQFAKKPKNPV